jgi:hypothetical protein
VHSSPLFYGTMLAMLNVASAISSAVFGKLTDLGWSFKPMVCALRAIESHRVP